MKTRKYLVYVEVEIDPYGDEDDNQEPPLAIVSELSCDVYFDRSSCSWHVVDSRVVGARLLNGGGE